MTAPPSMCVFVCIQCSWSRVRVGRQAWLELATASRAMEACATREPCTLYRDIDGAAAPQARLGSSRHWDGEAGGTRCTMCASCLIGSFSFRVSDSCCCASFSDLASRSGHTIFSPSKTTNAPPADDPRSCVRAAAPCPLPVPTPPLSTYLVCFITLAQRAHTHGQQACHLTCSALPLPRQPWS